MENKANTPDLLYGLDQIADFLGITVRQAKYRVQTKSIPSFKVGRTVCSKRASLNARLSELEAKGGTHD